MRILIAQTSFLGDVVLSTPVCAALRRRYPEAHITMWVRPDTAGVLEGHPAVDAVLIDDKRGRTRGLGSIRVVRALRQGRFDLALALHKSLRTAWMVAAARIPQRIGFRQSAGWLLYHRRVARDATRHEVERNLSILAAIGMEPTTAVTRPFLACPPGATARLHTLLRAHDVAPGARLLGVTPGSAWATKRWTVEGYAGFLAEVQRACGAAPVLLGARGDVAYAEAVQRATPVPVINLVGQTDLGMLIAAIDRCLVLVTNDSAPMHIAAARNTPVVAIFGPTTPSQGYGPYTERAVVVQRELSCRPCSRHGGPVCPIGTHACMREISPADVLRAVTTLLARDSEPRVAARS